MSPTILVQSNCRFFFFSHEEDRPHVHVQNPDGEAKFWLEPIVALANSYGLTPKELSRIQKIVEEHRNDFTHRWKRHLKS